MNKKQFALSAAAFVVALALVSCEPLRGCAVEIGYEEQAGISDYLNAGNTALFNIDFRLEEDEDGNRSKRLQIYALQSGMLSTQTQIYDNMDFSLAPSSVTFSGSGVTGLYKSYKDNRLHAVSMGLVSGDLNTPLAMSDEFSISFSADNLEDGSIASSFVNANRIRYSAHILTNTNSTTFYIPNSSYFTNRSKTYSFTPIKPYIDLIINSSASPPLLFQDFNFLSSVGAISGCLIGGYGVSVTLPESTVDTDKPWDYYNNVLLPYMEQEFPGYEQYFVFPDGYTPQEPTEPPSTVPTENPTLPGFDFALETNGTEPVTNVNYNIPEMPGKDVSVPVFDFTQINPVEVMAPVADGLRGIWQLISMVLAEYELFPYVALAIFAAIVVMLLHLGK